MTPNTMQPLTDFIERVYFPAKKAIGALKASTLVGYDNLYERHFKPRISGQRMCDFSPRVAQQFVDAIAAERAIAGTSLSSGTLRHIKWFGVGVFDYAKNTGAFPDQYENPFFRVKIPKTKAVSQPTRYATLDDVLDMIDVLPDTAATVVAVAAFAGLRKSEIQGLKWEDLRRGELHLRAARGEPQHLKKQRLPRATHRCRSLPNSQNTSNITAKALVLISSLPGRRCIALLICTTLPTARYGQH